MFNRLTTVIQSAVDALAPPPSRQDDFVYHWKMIKKFYLNRNSNEKVSIESTNIEAHSDQLLKILLEEEDLQEYGTTGPCLEYFLHHHLTDIFVVLACTDSPPGMRQCVFNFLRKVIVQIKQPILPHVSIYEPFKKLVSMCNGRVASPTESDEIAFLCTLCAVISNHPHLINIFYTQQNMLTSVTSEVIETHRVNAAVKDIVETNCLEPEQQLSGFKSDDINSECEQIETDIEIATVSLIDSLASFLFSADSMVTIKACEGIMVVTSLPSDAHALYISEHSSLCNTISGKLQTLFEAVPAIIDPADLDDLQITWGFDTPQWSEGNSFDGCRQVAAFFAWLDYCDQLIRESHPVIGSSLAKCIRHKFFEDIIEQQLLSSEDAHGLTLIAFINKCLKIITAPALLEEFIYWLIGESRDPDPQNLAMYPVREKLLDNCLHESDEVSLESMRLFEILMEKNSEHIFHSLILAYLNSRAYYESSAESCIASWSDEDEEERDKHKQVTSLDFSPDSSPISRTLAPSNIHRIINSFVFLLPQEFHTTDSQEFGYEQYIQDANRQYQDCVTLCSRFGWPLEATFPDPVEPDDCCSSDSRPEADHENQFFEGPLLKMLFTRILQMPYQSYQINLQLTGLVSRIATLPHAYVHEYIMNPLLPIHANTKTLFSVLQAVATELIEHLSSIPNYKDILLETRSNLLGSEGKVQENDCLYQSFIVLEEFCKELASIAFVKYHHFS